MIKYLFGSLLAGVLGYLCAIGGNGSNGWIQLACIVALSGICGIAIGLVAYKHKHIMTLYTTVFTLGVVANIVATQVQGA